ncbi:MAG: hypothetical protein BGO49_11535 [Planctomycetales bacterium 71-10]|nr:MAG: hypothetical protein BGO49_11535 [Planctomycetales bacterium 71-10]
MRKATFYRCIEGRTLEACVAIVRTADARRLDDGWSLKALGPYTIAFRLRAVPGDGTAIEATPATASRRGPSRN